MQRLSSVFVRCFATQLPRGAVAVEAVGLRTLPKLEKAAAAAAAASGKALDAACGPLPAADDDLSDMVSVVDPKTKEWGGPTKGGTMPEPTRFGDWERKGRCSEWGCACAASAFTFHSAKQHTLLQTNATTHSLPQPQLLPPFAADF